MTTKHILLVIGLAATTLASTSCNFSTEQKRRIVRKEAGKDDFRDSEKWGKVVTRTLTLDPFTHINLVGNADIKFHQGDELEVEVQGNENAIDLNDITAKDDTLTIRPKRSDKGIVPSIKLKVTAPNLESIDISGTGDIDLKDETHLEGDLAIHISGQGDIEVEHMKCRRLTIQLSGSGDITAQKIKCKKADISISGPGDMKADVKANDIHVDISGSGNADLDVKCKNLTVTAGGTGEIELKGECSHLTKQLGSMGSIDSRKLTIHEGISIQ